MQQEIQPAVGNPEPGPAFDVGELPDVETGTLPVSHIIDTTPKDDGIQMSAGDQRSGRDIDQTEGTGSGKTSIAVAVMLCLIRFYQKAISPYLPCCCRFEPSCSHYSAEAFRKRGFIAGMILTIWRILRCQPLCKGGYDPVPDHGFHRVTEENHRTGEEK